MGLDRHIYFRSEVSVNNPTGKRWVHIQASIETELPKKEEVFLKYFLYYYTFLFGVLTLKILKSNLLFIFSLFLITSIIYLLYLIINK